MKKTITAMEARRKFGEILEGVHYRNDEVVIQRNGKTMGVLISPDQYEIIEQNRERLWETIDAIRERNKDVPYDVIQREVDEAVSAVRKRRSAKRSA